MAGITEKMYGNQGGGSGGDSHNKGSFLTPEALREAYPTANAGDFAIVESTDTVWVWDSDGSQWKDSDQKGEVTSVNGQTGDVVIPNELPSQTGHSGKFLTTDGTDASWGTTVGAPMSVVDTDTLQNEKRIFTFGNGTDSGRYWHFKTSRVGNSLEIGAGTDEYVSLMQYSFRPKSGGISDLGAPNQKWKTTYTTKINNGSDIDVPAVAGKMAVQVSTLPTAASTNEGEIYQFIGTTDANYTNGYFYKCTGAGDPVVYSWSRVDVQPEGLVNTATGTDSLTVLGSVAAQSNSINIGVNSYAGSQSVSIGNSSYSYGYSVVVGYDAAASGTGTRYSIALGRQAKVTVSNAIQLNAASTQNTNADANTVKIANANGNFEIMSADGSIPSDRLVHAINKYSTMPTAASTNEGWIVQFTGTTDSTYTHGHLYECVSDGQATPTYSWTEVSLGGGSSYTAGTGIDITSGVISVASPTLVNNSVSGTYRLAVGDGATAGQNSANAFGVSASANSSASLAVGYLAIAQGNYSVAIGARANTSAVGAIQINATGSIKTNSDTNTMKVANANGNFEMMSADGTIPTARLTKVNSTITLTSAGWSSNTQTVNVTGMTADGVVMVSPDPTDQSAYTSAGILCTAQAAGTLTFTCDTVPSADIDVNVVML